MIQRTNRPTFPHPSVRPSIHHLSSPHRHFSAPHGRPQHVLRPKRIHDSFSKLWISGSLSYVLYLEKLQRKVLGRQSKLPLNDSTLYLISDADPIHPKKGSLFHLLRSGSCYVRIH